MNAAKLAFLFFLASTCSAQSFLPTKPEPVIVLAVAPTSTRTVHQFWDRPQRIEAGIAFGLAAWDSGKTCVNLANGGHEFDLPTQKCSRVIEILLADVAAEGALAWMLHKTGHHRLERLAWGYTTYQNAAGLHFSYTH